MLLDPGVVASESAALAGMIGLAALKGVLVGVLVGWIWRSRRLAILAGLGLAQIGEFSFVLAGQGVSAGVITAVRAGLPRGLHSRWRRAVPHGAPRRLAHWGAGLPTQACREQLGITCVIGWHDGAAVARVLRETGSARRRRRERRQREESGPREGPRAIRDATAARCWRWAPPARDRPWSPGRSAGAARGLAPAPNERGPCHGSSSGLRGRDRGAGTRGRRRGDRRSSGPRQISCLLTRLGVPPIVRMQGGGCGSALPGAPGAGQLPRSARGDQKLVAGGILETPA
jgi:hypothetical protein